MVKDLTTGSPAKVIFIYSLPVILGNVFQQIYNFVDNVIVGRYVSYEALAGVGVTNGMTFLVLGFIVGVTSGFGVKTAHYVGAKDVRNIKRSVGTSLIICVFMAALLTVLAVTLCKPLLKLMGVSSDIFGYASDYVSVVFAGLTAQTAYNMIACVLRALGDSKTPLYFLIVSSILNVGLDLLFVCGFGWSVKGAAFATVLAQLTSAILCFVYAYRKYHILRLSKEDFKTSWAFIWEHLAIGLPMAFQFSITAVGIVFLNAALASFPAPYIAGFSAANKIQNVGALVPISFGVAMANFAGQNFGAGRIDRLRQGVKATIAMSLGVCVVVSSILFLCHNQLTSLFLDPSLTDTETLYYASGLYQKWSAALFPFLFLIFIFRNALQGIGKTFWPLMAGVGELLFRAILSFVLPAKIGYIGVVVVDGFTWVVACLILVVSYYFIILKPDRHHLLN